MSRRQREKEEGSDKNLDDQATFTAWVMKGGAGSIGNLEQRQLPVVPPQSDQVTVQVRAIGLNFADLFTLLGLYSATPSGEFIPGLEFSGVIVAKGSQVSSDIKIGTRIFGCTRFGGFTQRINIDSRYVRRLPDHWSFAEGAAFLAQSLTAYFGLVTLGGLKKGQTVLIHSAAGGTGYFAVKIAQLAGAFPIGTVSSDDKVDALTKPIEQGGILAKPLPVQAVINRSSCGSDRKAVLIKSISSSYQDDPLMRARQGQTLDLVFDSLLGEWFLPAWNILEPMGRHVVLGAGSMTPQSDSVFSGFSWLKLIWQYFKRPMIDPLETISLNKSFLAFNLIWLYNRYDEMARIMDEMLEVLGFENGGRFVSSSSDDSENNKKKKQNKNTTNTTDDTAAAKKNVTEEVKPVVGCTFKFDQLPDAIRHFQSGKTIGKVVVEI